MSIIRMCDTSLLLVVQDDQKKREGGAESSPIPLCEPYETKCLFAFKNDFVRSWVQELKLQSPSQSLGQ